MKKLISFALVVVMLLSTLVLSSCDEALKILNDYLDSQKNLQKEIRNTVTDEEWADIFQSNNFTYIMRSGTHNADGTVTYVETAFSCSAAGIQIKVDGVAGAYYVNIDGVDTMFTYDRFDGWKQEISNTKLSEIDTLDEMYNKLHGISLSQMFEMVEYNEESKTYVLEKDGVTVEFYFEDGKLVYYHFKQGDQIACRVENVGTTTFEFPDFNAGTDNGDNDDSDEEMELQYTLNDQGDGYIVSGIGDYGNRLEADIVIPDTYKGLPVVAIGEEAFYKDRAYQRIKSVVIPASVKTIGKNAFMSCYILQSVTFAENSQLVRVDDWAFRNCDKLPGIDLPDGVQYVGDAAFIGCILLETVDLGTSLKYLGEGVFNGCKVLNNVVIPETITTIKSAAFQNCTKLTSIVIHGNIDTIEDWAFRDATALKSIFIPATVVNMGEDVFDGCDITIYCEATSAPEGWNVKWNQSYDDELNAYYFEPLWGQSAQ